MFEEYLPELKDCKCRKIKYCSVECAEKHWKIHKKKCTATKKRTPKFQKKKSSRKSTKV